MLTMWPGRGAASRAGRVGQRPARRDDSRLTGKRPLYHGVKSVNRLADGGSVSRIRRGMVAVALAGGLVAVGQFPGLASAAGPTITIAAKSKLKPVTGFVYVKYRQGADATAKIRGSIAGAAAGDVAKVFAQRFPYRKAPVLVGSKTLSSSSGHYSFTVTPTLATR